MPEYLTTSQAAELRGVSKRRLRQIHNEDNPPPRHDAESYDARKYGEWLVSQSSSEGFDYNAERARLTKFQADEKELQVKVLEGDLVPSDQVVEMIETLISNARAKLLNLPIKAAQVALAAKDLKEIEREIKELVYEALSELSDGNFEHTEKIGNSLEATTTLNS